MSDFNTLWCFIVKRSVGFPTVQEYHEFEHVFNLMHECESYLEVGAAEGTSLYVLAHALRKGAHITYVDWDEEHTRQPRNEILALLEDYKITAVHGNTHDPEVVKQAAGEYDAVLIDAGHNFDDVIEDAFNYGGMAKKYIIFHDICLPEVNRAFEEYCKQRPECKTYKMINSKFFGYGIMKI